MLDCFDWIHSNIQRDCHMPEGCLSPSYGWTLVRYNNVLMDFWWSQVIFSPVWCPCLLVLSRNGGSDKRLILAQWPVYTGAVGLQLFVFSLWSMIFKRWLELSNTQIENKTGPGYSPGLRAHNQQRCYLGWHMLFEMCPQSKTAQTFVNIQQSSRRKLKNFPNT